VGRRSGGRERLFRTRLGVIRYQLPSAGAMVTTRGREDVERKNQNPSLREYKGPKQMDGLVGCGQDFLGENSTGCKSHDSNLSSGGKLKNPSGKKRGWHTILHIYEAKKVACLKEGTLRPCVRRVLNVLNKWGWNQGGGIRV